MTIQKIDILNIIIAIIVLIAFISFSLYNFIKSKLHDSYHNGYNECRNNEIQYYKTMRDLDNSFTKIMNLLDNERMRLSIKTSQEILNFRTLIRKNKDKY